MIPIPAPSMAINSYQAGDTTGYNTPVLMQATNTYYVGKAVTPADMISNIRTVLHSPVFGGHMRRLILCCHGRPAYLALGTGIDQATIATLAHPDVVGRIEEIWLRACLVARIQTPDGRGTTAPGLRPFVTGVANGGTFCQAFADAMNSVVVASTELQATSGAPLPTRHGIPELPLNQMDEWDGLVVRFRPHAEAVHHRYRSGRLVDPNDAHRMWGN